MVVVKLNLKIVKIFSMLNSYLLDEFFRGNSLLPGLQHNRGPVSIVCTHIVDIVATTAKEAYPDIRLNVFNQVSEMNRPVRIRQRTGDENISSVVGHQSKGLTEGQESLRARC